MKNFMNFGYERPDGLGQERRKRVGCCKIWPDIHGPDFKEG